MNSILFSGVNKAKTDLMKRKVSLSNFIGLLVGILTLPFAYIFTSSGAETLGLLCLPFSLVFFLSILFNKYGWFTLARLSIILSWSIGVLFYTLELRTDSGIQNCYFVLLCLSFILFSPIETSARSISILIPIVGYFLIELDCITWDNQIELEASEIDTIRLFINPTIFIQLASVLWYNSSYEKNLIEAVAEENYKNSELTKSQKKLYKSADQIVDQQNQLFGAMSKSEQSVLEIDEKGTILKLWTQSQESKFKVDSNIGEYLGDQVNLSVRATFEKWERGLNIEQKETFSDSLKQFNITLVKSQGKGVPKATMFIRVKN